MLPGLPEIGYYTFPYLKLPPFLPESGSGIYQRCNSGLFLVNMVYSGHSFNDPFYRQRQFCLSVEKKSEYLHGFLQRNSAEHPVG